MYWGPFVRRLPPWTTFSLLRLMLHPVTLIGSETFFYPPAPLRHSGWLFPTSHALVNEVFLSVNFFPDLFALSYFSPPLRPFPSAKTEPLKFSPRSRLQLLSFFSPQHSRFQHLSACIRAIGPAVGAISSPLFRSSKSGPFYAASQRGVFL